MRSTNHVRLAVYGLLLTALVGIADADESAETSTADAKSFNVLFVGNSYTARHNLANVVKAMAQAADPNLSFNVTTVIYGGRTLKDHARLGTLNYLRLDSLTEAEQQATVASLEKHASDPKDKYAKSALARHKKLLSELDQQRTHFDLVVLQSYRDDLDGADSFYMQYAPKFAALAKEQGTRVVLYETTPTTQNAKPLAAAPDPKPVLEKARSIADLANRIDASVAPMSLVALQCQTARPDFTLRFINDAHLNQTLAYLTACTLYAAIFEKSPQGSPVDSITDIRYLDNKDKTKDRDGGPITRVFSEKDRSDLQRIAWESYQRFQKMRND